MDGDWLAERFEADRARLQALAYRVLGQRGRRLFPRVKATIHFQYGKRDEKRKRIGPRRLGAHQVVGFLEQLPEQSDRCDPDGVVREKHIAEPLTTLLHQADEPSGG